MSAAARRCASCGADAPRPEARFCEHCGATLASTPPPPPPDPFGDVAARFRALLEHADLAHLLRATPEVPELAGKTLPSFLFLLFLAVLGLFASLLCFQVCPPLGFAPLALVGVGFLVLVRQMLWSARAPLTAHPALIVELRAKLHAGAEHSPAHTRHFVTLQFEDGRRAEHECYTSALAGLEVGALGVAYLKGDRLAAFAGLTV